MVLLQKSDILVSEFINSNKATDNSYNFSKFNIIKTIAGKKFLINTLSRAVLELADTEFQSIKSEALNQISLNNAQLYKCLQKNFFIIPKNIDEIKTYQQLLLFYRTLLAAQNNKITQYKIFTTTGCNARCFYCFEEGMSVVTMNTKVADKLISYIEKTHNEKKFTLYWFGGEPLCNSAIIDYISDALNKKGMTFESKIITNGFLFDGNMIFNAKNKWNLKFAQITLDGMEATHNQRKNYANVNISPFKKTLENISKLIDNEIFVSVRLNFDEENFDEILTLVEFLSDKFKNNKYFRCYPAIISSDWLNHNANRSNEVQDDLIQKYQQVFDKISSKNLMVPRKFASRIKAYYCMASNPRNVTISADGLFYTCQSCDIEMSYGDLFNGVTKPHVLNTWQRDTGFLDKCANCEYLPECCAFDKCPSSYPECHRIKDSMVELQIKNLINAYCYSDKEIAGFDFEE